MSTLHRRDFLEKLLYALSAALLALFGVRFDLEHEEVRRFAKSTAKKLTASATSITDILKTLWPQSQIYGIAYAHVPRWSL